MINWQGMLFGAGLGALVAASVAWQVRGGIEKAACATEIEKVKAAAARIIDGKDIEIGKIKLEKDFAIGEVAKVNATIALQLSEQKALLLADQASREEAARKSDSAAAAAAKQSRDTAAKFQQALEALKNDPDQCARAPISPDVRRMLDDILKGSAS